MQSEACHSAAAFFPQRRICLFALSFQILPLFSSDVINLTDFGCRGALHAEALLGFRAQPQEQLPQEGKNMKYISNPNIKQCNRFD